MVCRRDIWARSTLRNGNGGELWSLCYGSLRCWNNFANSAAIPPWPNLSAIPPELGESKCLLPRKAPPIRNSLGSAVYYPRSGRANHFFENWCTRFDSHWLICLMVLTLYRLFRQSTTSFSRETQFLWALFSPLLSFSKPPSTALLPRGTNNTTRVSCGKTWKRSWLRVETTMTTMTTMTNRRQAIPGSYDCSGQSNIFDNFRDSTLFITGTGPSNIQIAYPKSISRIKNHDIYGILIYIHQSNSNTLQPAFWTMAAASC